MAPRRRLYWLAVLAGAALFVAGGVVTALGLTTTDSPAAVVRGYFAALARGDAPHALAFGNVPAGPRRLLTNAVLRQQLRIASLGDVTIAGTAQHGDRATVGVRYTLDFPTRPVTTSVHVPLHRSSGNWRLDRVAVGTVLAPNTAVRRVTLLAAALPARRTLLFPGALPLWLDTPYLELDPRSDYVSFDTSATLEVRVRISDSGRAALRSAIRARLTRCLTGADDLTCPLPTERYVPGSVRGAVTGALGGDIELDASDPAGLLRYSGTPTIRGSWRRLDFHNRRLPGSGRVLLDVRAVAYAVEPGRLSWI